MEYVGRRFTGAVELDGNSFENCAFERATLIYRGGELPRFLGRVHSHACDWRFEDAAGRTLQLMQQIYNSQGGEDIADQLFPFVAKLMVA